MQPTVGQSRIGDKSASECASPSARPCRTAAEGGGGERGEDIPAPPRTKVEEEDNSKAPAALQRDSDQGRRDLRRAEAQNLDFVHGESLSELGSSSWSSAPESGVSRGTQQKGSQGTLDCQVTRGSEASGTIRALLPVRSTVSGTGTSSRGCPPPPEHSLLSNGGLNLSAARR